MTAHLCFASALLRHGRIGLLAVPAVLSPLAVPAQNLFRGDAARSGLFAGDGPAELSHVRWTYKTGGAVVSSPVVADGVLFVGSDDNSLHAVDLATGTTRWTFATKGPVRSSPAVAGGTAFFSSYDGSFHAVDVATGKERWRFAITGERKFTAKGLHGYFPRGQPIPDFWDLFQSSPVVDAGRVYFGCGDGQVHALDAATGAVVWTFATGDVVHASPALADGTLYFGSWDTFFYAVEARTGALKWKFKTGADPENFNQTGLPSSPCVANGVVFFGCRDSHLYALDAETGREKWRYKNTWVIASPTVRDGRVYCTTSIPAFFFALDAATGKEIYKVDVKVPAFSSPALAGGRAYFGTFAGRLLAIDVATGGIAAEFRTSASKANARGVLKPDGGLDLKVLFTSKYFEDMYVAGEKLFSLGAIVSSPVVAGGVVYVGSTDGNVYALE